MHSLNSNYRIKSLSLWEPLPNWQVCSTTKQAPNTFILKKKPTFFYTLEYLEIYYLSLVQADLELSMYPRMTFEVLIFDLYLLRIGAVPSHFTKQYWGLHPGPCACQASTVLPEPRPLASPLHTSGKECWLRYIVPFPIAMPSKALHNKHWPPLIVITNALLFILGFTLPYAVG